MSDKPFDESFALDGSRGRIRRHVTGNGTYCEGIVMTVHGIVWVYSQEGRSRYNFAYAGRQYMRTEYRERTERGLAIQATKFAAHVAASASTRNRR